MNNFFSGDLTLGGILKITIAEFIVALIFCAFQLHRIKRVWGNFRGFCVFYSKFNSIRMTRFVRDREDYSGTKAYGIANYIKTAKRTVKVVGINLVTGVDNDDVISAIRQIVSRLDFPVKVTISLLDPCNRMTISAIAKTLGNVETELASSISSTLRKLIELKGELSKSHAEHLTIKAHQTVPFASAIIIDSDDLNRGEIQIETKPYHQPTNKSFGFTLRAGGSHPLYKTLVSSYERLIEDGRFIKKAADIQYIK